MRIDVFYCAKLALALGLISQAARANDVVLTQTAYFFADGGEFTATDTPDGFSQNYAATTRDFGAQDTFQTFCIEANVYFWPNVTYSYTLSQTDSQGRVLTEGAALLYQQFASGVLLGYDFSNANGDRTADAGLLQAALWQLQGGQTGNDSFPNGGAGNPYYDLAARALGSSLLAADNGKYGVDILELWDSSNNTYQNQLVYDHQIEFSYNNLPPVPDGGPTLWLLLLSAAALGWYARCQRGHEVQLIHQAARIRKG